MNEDATPAVVGRGVRVAYGSNVAIDASDFRLDCGTVTALIGPNGSGKTSLLHAIAGVLPLASGTIERSESGIATVFQSTPEVEELPLSVRATVAMARYGRRGWFQRLDGVDKRVVQDAMERLDVARLADRQLRELSGGERQRALVAQGVAQEADVLLLDEPITGLDIVSRDLIVEVMETERAAGRTVVVSTHDLRDAERVDQVILLSRRIVVAGPPSDVLTERWLSEAYGTRLVRVGEAIFLDDAHHHH